VTRHVDVLVVGAGFAGLLAARGAAAGGRAVLVLERGGMKSQAEQRADGHHEVAGRTTAPVHVSGPEQPDYPWNYALGVGGGSLRWTGAAPRLLESDFRLRTEHGVGRDWPLGYEDLEPFYVEAERLLLVAGGDSPMQPRTAPLPLPAHRLSPADEIVASAMPPFAPLPQARLSVPVNGRSACCADTGCALCPVDAKTTMLHVMRSERLLERGIELQERTVVDRLERDGSRIVAALCVDERGRRSRIEAETVVLAAGGFENPAILLRSGLDGPDVGRWLFDHSHRLVHVELDRPFGAGRGATHISGISWAFADGPWRRDFGSQIVMPFNQGTLASRRLRDGILDGSLREGGREALRDEFERTLVLDVLGEDLPMSERRIELTRRRDRMGLQRARIRYRDDSPYLEDARRRLYAEIEHRLAPWGGRVRAVERAGEGSHQLGTCHIAESGGVVDADLRHHELSNLRVVGGSAFPTYSAHHPTLTICALAIRLGRALGEGA
jgi:choline dehydrogenase-like flavoprotein